MFPGNTFESKTLESALEKLEKRFGLRQVIIVADRGMNSKLNLKKIHDRGYRYIVATRIRKMNKQLTEALLDFSGHTEISNGEDEPLFFKVKEHLREIKDDGQTCRIPERLVFTYSAKRAKKDREDRRRLVEKAHLLLQSPSKNKASAKKGGRKYLKELGTGSVFALDEASIAQDERFDGYYGLQTNDQNLDPKAVLEAYHTLWKIEESFRLMKSTWKSGRRFTRPSPA